MSQNRVVITDHEAGKSLELGGKGGLEHVSIKAIELPSEPGIERAIGSNRIFSLIRLLGD